ncbi:MAG TPA: aspartate aminotransferase family protein [Candidatus Limiplasma sp.]|nr:aspartate aminotransferase family protein [Candidatus Limiplasma sp.]
MSNIKDLEQQYIAPTYARFDVAFVRGEGATLWDDAGKQYIDMGSGIAVNALGYGNKAWAQAVCEQANKLAHVSNLYYTQPQGELAKILCERTGMQKVFFANSGAEANECAIKAARKYAADKHGENVKPVIITLNDSFHGRTLATLAATGQDVFHHHFGPFPEDFMHVPPNDIDALQKALDQYPVCALMLEVVQGEGGVEPLNPAYIKAARELTEARDVLLAIDEVQTGNGRLGTLFGFQQFGILPDIVTTAKGLAGGLPMGACLLGGKVEHTLSAGTHATTFGGNPVCAAAAVAVMNQLTDELLDDVKKKGEYIKAELDACPSVTRISGYGLMLGVQSEKDAKALVKTLLDQGVVTLTAKTKLRLLPPLTISWEQLTQAVSIIKEALQ